MTPPRLSFASLMAVVGVIALDLAAARALLACNEELLVGITLSGLVLQVGIIRLIRSRGTGRAFWAGFIVCGLATMLTFVWAMMHPESLGISRTGTLVRTPGSPLYDLWHGYARFVCDRIIEPVLYDPRIDPDPEGNIAILVIRAMVWSLPQMTIALVGGLSAWWVGSPLTKRPVATGVA